MTASRWQPPAGSPIAARFLHPTYVVHLNAWHRIDCQALKRVPLAKMRACNLDAIPSNAHPCPLCIAPSLQTPRREPARVTLVKPRRDARRTSEAERDP